MDDVGIGTVCRRLRIRLGWTQEELAGRAGVSQATISRLERGHVAEMNLRALRRVGGTLDLRFDLVPRWRGGELDRMLGSRHAAMHEEVAALLVAAGWQAAPEVTFNHFGERGVIDILAWQPARRALLVIELKTELVDPNELVGTMDRRRRLAATIARERGWDPLGIGVWVVFADSRTTRRRIAAHRTFLRAAFPADGRSFAAWLRRPSGAIAALSFLPPTRERSRRRGLVGVRRVRPSRPSTGASTHPATHAARE